MSAPDSVVAAIRRHRVECSSKATGEVSCSCRETGWMTFSAFAQHQADAAWDAAYPAALRDVAAKFYTSDPAEWLRRLADESEASRG